MNHKQHKMLGSIKKRFETSLIGSLARFEKYFSHLWEEDGEDAEHFFELWQKTRNEILNHGNNQARAAMEDLENFMDYNQGRYKYQYKFYNKNQENKYYE
jgi:hypothetical protein